MNLSWRLKWDINFWIIFNNNIDQEGNERGRSETSFQEHLKSGSVWHEKGSAWFGFNQDWSWQCLCLCGARCCWKAVWASLWQHAGCNLHIEFVFVFWNYSFRKKRHFLFVGVFSAVVIKNNISLVELRLALLKNVTYPNSKMIFFNWVALRGLYYTNTEFQFM